MVTSASVMNENSDATITPIPLMQMATAFWAFKTLSTAVEMDLFTHLATSPMTASETAQWFRIHERPAEMLLTGCAGLGLLRKENGRYSNTPLAYKFLVRGGRYYFGGFVSMLNRRLYSGWDKLPEAVSTNRPTTWNPDKQASLFEGADPGSLPQPRALWPKHRRRRRGQRDLLLKKCRARDLCGGGGVERDSAEPDTARSGRRRRKRAGDERATALVFAVDDKRNPGAHFPRRGANAASIDRATLRPADP